MVSPLFSVVAGKPIVGSDVLLQGVALDSRDVEPGYLFCAVKGEVTDGHRYIEQAIERGAVAVVVEDTAAIEGLAVSYCVDPDLKKHLGCIAARFYQQPTTALNVVGVTGTNGKTSVTSYISQLLRLLDKPCGEMGTLGICYQGHRVETPNTTADAVTLQRYFKQMQQAGVEVVAIEVSSHAMDQGRCQGTRFDTVVFTNLTHDHLDYHGDFESYKRAKMQLFTWPEVRCAVVNLDDDAGKSFLAEAVAELRLSYSLMNDRADYYLSAIKKTSTGYRAQLHCQQQELDINVPLLGDFNLLNLLAAVAVVHQQGFALDDVVSQCASLKPVAGRMQAIENNLSLTAVVDYAHTPDALEKVLQSLRAHTQKRLIVVFGCGGDRDRQKRPQMGAIAEANSDLQIVTADNPRSESIDVINQQIAAGMKGSACQIIADRRHAIVTAVELAEQGDCVLIAGKGHEDYQLIGNERLVFDDCAELKAALTAREAA